MAGSAADREGRAEAVRTEPAADRGASSQSTGRARLSAAARRTARAGRWRSEGARSSPGSPKRSAGGGRAGRRSRSPTGQSTCTWTSARFTSCAGVGTLLAIALAVTLLRLALQLPLSILPGADRRRRAGAAAPRPVPRLHARLLGGAVARPRGTAAGDDDQSGDAGDRRRAAGDGADHLAVHLPRADRLRARAQRAWPPSSCSLRRCCCSGCCGRCARSASGAPARSRGPRCSTPAGSARRSGWPRRRRCSAWRTRSASASTASSRPRDGSSSRTQLLGQLVPNLYQSLIYLLFVVGLCGLYAVGTSHAASLGAVVLLLVRAAQYGQQSQTAYQGLCASRCRSSSALQDAARRYAQSAPLEGRLPLQAVQTLAFEDVALRLPRRAPGALGHQLRGRAAARRSASSARRARASRRWCSSCCGCGAPTTAATWSTGRRRASSRARTGTGGSPTCPRNRACCTPRWRTTSATSATSTTRRWSAPRGWRASTTTS